MSESPAGFQLIQDIDVRLTVELGTTTMPLRDILALGEDSIVMLERLSDEPLDVMVNGRRIARGEVIAQGNRFGLRILELEGRHKGAGAVAGGIEGIKEGLKEGLSQDLG